MEDSLSSEIFEFDGGGDGSFSEEEPLWVVGNSLALRRVNEIVELATDHDSPSSATDSFINSFPIFISCQKFRSMKTYVPLRPSVSKIFSVNVRVTV